VKKLCPNPGDFKPCSRREIEKYTIEALSRNVHRLEKLICPECHNLGTFYFTGELLDLDAAFVICKSCGFKSWVLLKMTGLPCEKCRYLANQMCTNTGKKCQYISSDLRYCELFKEAVSVSHRERKLRTQFNRLK